MTGLLRRLASLPSLLPLLARGGFALILCVCLAVLGFALYLERVEGLLPCPLCIVQRVVYLAMALVALLGLLHGPGVVGLRVYNALLVLLAVCGGAVAGRQVHLQHLPAEQLPECGPDLSYMLDVFPWREALMMILRGSGECAEVQWRFLGLSIPEWSLVLFSLLAVGAAVLFLSARRLRLAGRP